MSKIRRLVVVEEHFCRRRFEEQAGEVACGYCPPLYPTEGTQRLVITIAPMPSAYSQLRSRSFGTRPGCNSEETPIVEAEVQCAELGTRPRDLLRLAPKLFEPSVAASVGCEACDSERPSAVSPSCKTYMHKCRVPGTSEALGP